MFVGFETTPVFNVELTPSDEVTQYSDIYPFTPRQARRLDRMTRDGNVAGIATLFFDTLQQNIKPSTTFAEAIFNHMLIVINRISYQCRSLAGLTTHQSILFSTQREGLVEQRSVRILIPGNKTLQIFQDISLKIGNGPASTEIEYIKSVTRNNYPPPSFLFYPDTGGERVQITYCSRFGDMTKFFLDRGFDGNGKVKIAVRKQLLSMMRVQEQPVSV